MITVQSHRLPLQTRFISPKVLENLYRAVLSSSINILRQQEYSLIVP